VADPNEPLLHLLLGHIYDRMGLKELAAEAFEEARVLFDGAPLMGATSPTRGKDRSTCWLS
jgi:Flp pilus assembly protein TadD